MFLFNVNPEVSNDVILKEIMKETLTILSKSDESVSTKDINQMINEKMSNYFITQIAIATCPLFQNKSLSHL